MKLITRKFLGKYIQYFNTCCHAVGKNRSWISQLHGISDITGDYSRKMLRLSTTMLASADQDDENTINGLRLALAKERAARERLLDPATWIDAYGGGEALPYGDDDDDDDDNIQVAFPLAQIIATIKHEHGIPRTDRETIAVLRCAGFDPTRPRAEVPIPGNQNEPIPALWWFCQVGDLQTCKWLFAHGAAADTHKTDSAGYGPMLLACATNQLAICQWLLSVGVPDDLRRPARCGTTPMHQACENGNLELARWLFEAGATEDMRAINSYGMTPMRLACRYGHLEVAQWLYDSGARDDVLRRDHFGWSPLKGACVNNRLDVLLWLLEMGAGVQIRDANNDGETPLFGACAGGHLDVAKLLHEVGAMDDIAVASRSGDTPLRAALRGRHFATCQWLILKGALNRSSREGADANSGGDIMSDANDDDESAVGHIDKTIVDRDLKPCNKDFRPALLEWARGVVTIHATFLRVVLRASVLVPRTQQEASPDKYCNFPRLPHMAMERVGSFLGVHTGRELRHARELAEALGDTPPQTSRAPPPRQCPSCGAPAGSRRCCAPSG